MFQVVAHLIYMPLMDRPDGSYWLLALLWLFNKGTFELLRVQ